LLWVVRCSNPGRYTQPATQQHSSYQYGFMRHETPPPHIVKNLSHTYGANVGPSWSFERGKIRGCRDVRVRPRRFTADQTTCLGPDRMCRCRMLYFVEYAWCTSFAQRSEYTARKDATTIHCLARCKSMTEPASFNSAVTRAPSSIVPVLMSCRSSGNVRSPCAVSNLISGFILPT
jgi:hypothetical protein